MSASIPIAINPPLLVWAREESGYPVERVAKGVQVKEERILEWERGERQPSMRQIENLAKFFHRPLSIFALVAERMPFAMVLSRSLMVNLLDQIERIVPTLTPAALEDKQPLIKPPHGSDRH